MLENVTNVIETLNIEDAEDYLNREITKLKLINESQISQRNITIENGVSLEEWDKDYQNFILSKKNKVLQDPYADVRISLFKDLFDFYYFPYSNINLFTIVIWCKSK